AQVEVDVELVARERHALGRARPDRREAHVLERQLRGAVARAETPAVAHEAVLRIERGLVEPLALAFRRAPDDQLDTPVVARRPADVLDGGLEPDEIQMLHRAK